MWEVIEFGDSYKVPTSTTDTKITDTTSGETGTKSGRTVTLTAEDMQKKKNNVKARTTLLLSLPDEHQLRFSSETLEQTFSRLQVIVGQLQFMDVEVEQDDLNQKFLTSLAPEWLMHTIVWRNKSDLDTIGNEDGNTACVPTASTNVPTASASVATINQDTACAFIASQSSGSQIKFEDINQIDEDDMEEMDIKWNMTLLSMRADKAPKSQDRGRRDNFRQGSKAEEQAPKALMTIDGVGWDWTYMVNDGEDYALVADEEAPTEFALMANTSTESKDLSWTGLPECKDDTITDYSRPEPTVESSPDDDKKRNPSVSETVASPIIPKPFVKFVKASDNQSKSKTDETETPKKSLVKAVPKTMLTTKAIGTVAALST
nr:hypothetical protein [Tanacetum cinerariifolium]